MPILTALVGIGTGILLGLFGSGGTLIAMPALHFILHIPTHSAIAMGFGIIALTATIAAFGYWRRGTIDLSVAGLFGLFGVCGAYIGARVGALVPAPLHLLAFALVMYYSAYRLLLAKTTSREPTDRSERLPFVAAYGFAIGGLAGLVGVGGGFLIVPALILLWELPLERAVGTSLVAVAANSLSGFAGYAGTAVVSYPIMALFAGTAIAGTFAGSALHKHLASGVIKLALGAFLAIAATYMIWQNINH